MQRKVWNSKWVENEPLEIDKYLHEIYSIKKIFIKFSVYIK